MTVFLELWRLLDRRRRRQLLGLQLLSLLMALCTVGGVAAVLPFFTVLAEPQAIARHPVLMYLFQQWGFLDERHFVIALGVGFAAVMVLANGVNLCGSLAIDRFAYRVGDWLHVSLFEEYLQRSYGFHVSTNSALLASRVLRETDRVTGGILRHVLILVTNAVTATFIVGSIMIVNPTVAACAILGLGAVYSAVYAAVRGRLLRNGRIESSEYAQRTQIVNESFGAIKEVLLTQAQGVFVSKFSQCCRSISQTIVSTSAISQSPKYILECATACVLVGVALSVSAGGASNGAWIAKLSFTGFALYRLLPALQQMYLATVRIRADRNALGLITPDLLSARERKRATGPAAAQSWCGLPLREIHLRGVSYSHSAIRPPVVAGVDLQIPAGSITGFVGSNGSGKTTLVDLISGLLVPGSGTVEIDGVVLDERNRAGWQSTIACVPQHTYIRDCTLAENIALGVPAALIDRDRLRLACRLAHLQECIESLPNGYDEVLGERGARLSGGQRQRVGIARALYRDASVLILDEATSAIDAEAESEILQGMAGLGLTILIVAHRPSTLRYCERVYELASGQIVQRSVVNASSNARPHRALNR
jgi:ATP-binding cassette, subfamily B, bacterial PglK